MESSDSGNIVGQHNNPLSALDATSPETPAKAENLLYDLTFYTIAAFREIDTSFGDSSTLVTSLKDSHQRLEECKAPWRFSGWTTETESTAESAEWERAKIKILSSIGTTLVSQYTLRRIFDQSNKMSDAFAASDLHLGPNPGVKHSMEEIYELRLPYLKRFLNLSEEDWEKAANWRASA
ncbi:hypothetical protein JMJ77_0009045 [Colletotrichum scovillei]|uniref:Uncharacterized protein n=1 Tax=Colletotrichum scovillei TaxID=1209932 RepID=A0A9P7QSJ5_9PEZI|nr:hypothetical protein JMJ78_0010764 [Colletotrichum scovillei]KAG7040770.1 hypothetical protein JMJ77_0009045 [Colletotrichum scovillei]KAG7060814.1 hypothetical protein JMJ76_0004028 [Colletotrichum scovillei]